MQKMECRPGKGVGREEAARLEATHGSFIPRKIQQRVPCMAKVKRNVE